MTRKEKRLHRLDLFWNNIHGILIVRSESRGMGSSLNQKLSEHFYVQFIPNNTIK